MAGKNPVTEVGFGTIVEWSTYRTYDGERRVIVEALKPCGCSGPWIGTLIAVPYREWPERFKREQRPEGSKPAGAKLWAFYPVSRDDQYGLMKRPQGYAFGKKASAMALRDWIARRNLGDKAGCHTSTTRRRSFA